MSAISVGSELLFDSLVIFYAFLIGPKCQCYGQQRPWFASFEFLALSIALVAALEQLSVDQLVLLIKTN